MTFGTHKKKIILTIEVIFLTVFVLYLIYYVDWKSISAYLQSANKFYFLAAILFYFLKIYAESVRWKYVLQLFNTAVPVLEIVKTVCVAPFFSIITIIPKAEEIYYFYFLKNEVNESSTALSILLTNRVIALTSLLILLPFTLSYLYFYQFPIVLDSYKIMRILFIGVGILVIITLIFLFIYRKKNVQVFIQKLMTSLKATFTLLKKRPRLLINLYFITFVSHLMYALTVYFLCASLGIQLPIIAIFLSVPAVYLLTSVIIGTKGIGVKEAIWAFIVLLFSISESKAIALSSLHFILSLIFIFIGLLLYLTNKQRYGAKAS